MFFSSHILTDIEAIADQVAIVARGSLQSLGTPAELVKRTVLGIDVKVRVPHDQDDNVAALTIGVDHVRRANDELSVTLAADADIDAWIEKRTPRAPKCCRSSLATKRSRTCSCAASGRRNDRPDLGDRAQHVPRGGADPRAVRHRRARDRGEPLRTRVGSNVDPRGRARRPRYRARGHLAVRIADRDLPRRISCSTPKCSAGRSTRS